jgi:hypothetical protein
MPDTSFVKDLFDILKSMVLAMKVVDQYEAGLRFRGGVLRTKRLRDSNIQLRERILSNIYDTNMLDIPYDKNQLEGILIKERTEMIEKGKLREDKVYVEKKPYEAGRRRWFYTNNPFYRPDYGLDFKKSFFSGKARHVDRHNKTLLEKDDLEKILSSERAVMIEKGKLLEDKVHVAKKPYEIGRHRWFHTNNPFFRPDYNPEEFKKTRFFGKASHIDRYTNVLPAGTWWLVPEFWFGYMRVATLPINIQTMEIENINIPTTDEDPLKDSVSIGLNFTYIILDAEKTYLGTHQYSNYLHTIARMHLSELSRGHGYDFWKGSSQVSPELAEAIDKNVASGLIKDHFNASNEGIWSYRGGLVKSDYKKSVDDLTKESKEVYKPSNTQDGTPIYRSNTSIISIQIMTALNMEMSNYGIFIPTTQVLEGALAKQFRLLHSGNVVPSDMNISQAVENHEAGRDY